MYDEISNTDLVRSLVEVLKHACLVGTIDPQHWRLLAEGVRRIEQLEVCINNLQKITQKYEEEKHANQPQPTTTNMSLSDRVRPNVEAAPWVIDEIKKLEDKIFTVNRFGMMSEDNVRAMAGAARLCGNADLLQLLSDALILESLAANADAEGYSKVASRMCTRAEKTWEDAINLAKK